MSASVDILDDFNGVDGEFPNASLITDASGDLFGTTGRGGATGDGTVFEIAKTVAGYAGTPIVLVNFNAVAGGYAPIGGGFGTVAGAVDDSGRVTAVGGTLDITGDVSGTGSLTFTSPASPALGRHRHECRRQLVTIMAGT